MTDYFADIAPATHLLAALVLLSRLADVVSTRLVSPTLRFEANPLVRRLGWRFAWGTLLLALAPYVSAEAGVVLVAASLLVASGNLARGWVARAIGEAEYDALLLRAAARTRRRTALGFVLSSGALAMLAGVVLMWLSGVPSWGYWFGVGIASYGLAIAGHGSAFVVRLFRRASAAAAA